MATQNVCRYFKFGFCRFKEMCRFMHISEVCENPSCEIKLCNLRHPRICNFLETITDVSLVNGVHLNMWKTTLMVQIA